MSSDQRVPHILHYWASHSNSHSSVDRRDNWKLETEPEISKKYVTGSYPVLPLLDELIILADVILVAVALVWRIVASVTVQWLPGLGLRWSHCRYSRGDSVWRGFRRYEGSLVASYCKVEYNFSYFVW